MTIVQFSEMVALSNSEISESIIETEKKLFDLQFKKATRQPFKPHEIRSAKRKLAQLKTVLTMRLDKLDKKRSNTVTKLLEKQNYMTGNF
jgi:ribosomal protein L29|tara:strand:- start:401 stop:670 length:270 start_codon:yes stop_codon:yes gene_type:complete